MARATTQLIIFLFIHHVVLKVQGRTKRIKQGLKGETLQVLLENEIFKFPLLPLKAFSNSTPQISLNYAPEKLPSLMFTLHSINLN